MNKRERAERAKQEDLILNKILLWIVGAVVLEALLLLLNQFYNHYTIAQLSIAVALRTALPILALLFAAGCAACVAWTVQRQKKGMRTGLPTALAIFCAALAICCLIARLIPSGIRVLYVAVPVVTVLAMVYYLYQREFFAISTLSAIGLAGLWLIHNREGHEALVYAGLAVLAVILVASAVVAWMLQSKQGVWQFKGKPIQILPANANYVMLYISCGLVAAVLAGGVALGALMLLYAVLVAWLLVMAVYYTVKLM